MSHSQVGVQQVDLAGDLRQHQAEQNHEPGHDAHHAIGGHENLLGLWKDREVIDLRVTSGR
ncbi:hypothetical protein [Thiomonas sp. FB-Cd]|uniref:hypothetical protein n=1 Tax=Thiomonas sp. FB-Cd TaxID=1158292 RepID=UPI0018CC55AE